MSVLPRIDDGTRVHWLLLGSLALNLFFVGAAGAVAYRYTGTVPLTQVTRIDHNLVGRLDRIAESLPPADSDVMREQLRENAIKIATARPIFACRRTMCAEACAPSRSMPRRCATP
jgi:uncharacterized membrane protein